jgi:DNA-binding NarL/FixJ family response regulator
MFNKLTSLTSDRYKALNIVIVESSRFCRNFLAREIAAQRSYHHIMAVDKIEEVFSLMYGEIEIDIIFFDLDSGLNLHDLSIIKAISEDTAFIHWSNCQHPEILELLHGLEVNSFCLKDSNPDSWIAAIDLIVTNPNILYLDERLNQCLPLLAG